MAPTSAYIYQKPDRRLLPYDNPSGNPQLLYSLVSAKHANLISETLLDGVLEVAMDHECQIESLERIVDVEEAARQEAAIFVVWGMGCQNCATRVRNKLIGTRGVLDAIVDYLTGMAWVMFNPDLVTTSELSAAVADAGNDGRHEYCARVLAQ